LSLATIKQADPDSPGKMAVKTERERYIYIDRDIEIWR